MCIIIPIIKHNKLLYIYPEQYLHFMYSIFKTKFFKISCYYILTDTSDNFNYNLRSVFLVVSKESRCFCHSFYRYEIDEGN